MFFLVNLPDTKVKNKTNATTLKESLFFVCNSSIYFRLCKYDSKIQRVGRVP